MANDLDEFKNQHLNGLLDRVRFWFLTRALYWRKRASLWEGLLDRQYFETVFKDVIGYNESDDRLALQEQNSLPYHKQDHSKVYELEQRITRAKAVKQSYRENEQFIDDTRKYISMLEGYLYPPETDEDQDEQTEA